MKFIQGFLTALIVLAIVAVAVAYSGVLNVAAGAPEPGILQWFLSTTMKHSVKSHAREVTASVELTDQRAREGFRIYRAGVRLLPRRAETGSRGYRQGPQSKTPLSGRHGRGLDQRRAVLDRQERNQDDRHGPLRRVAQG